MALLILEPGDTCGIPDQMEAGPHAGETVELISKQGTLWTVAGTDDLFTIEEKWLNLIRSV